MGRQRELENFTNLKDLVHEAHEKGVKSMGVQVTDRRYDKQGKPEAATAIATVIMEDGRIFVDEGDAHVGDLPNNMKPHVFRQAQSRAIARALRLATDNGETSVEELSPDDREEPRPAETKHPIKQETSTEIMKLADKVYEDGFEEMEREFRERRSNWALGRMSEEGAQELLHRLRERDNS